MKNPLNKPQKSDEDLVSGLLKYIDHVLDDVRNLKAHQSRYPDVDKYIRTYLDIAYHETKKLVEKILAERPEIKDAPTDSTDPNEYLRNARTWCVGLLYWEDGERIGVEKAATDLASEKPAEKEKNTEGSMIMITARSSKDIWEAIKSDYGIGKRDFGKKINFVSNSFKREIIFRDIEHAYVLSSHGFSKPALILAGGVIEELLRQYLKHKKISPKGKRFVDYIEACVENNLLKHGVSRLTDSIRDFRNLVHLENEKEKRYTVSKATAKGAVSSVFTIANDFQ